jgi:hypothetical protein
MTQPEMEVNRYSTYNETKVPKEPLSQRVSVQNWPLKGFADPKRAVK